MMTPNLFVIANVKQLRTDGSFRNLLPFSRTSWGVGVLNSVIFNSFHNRVEFGTILGGLRNFGGRGFEHPKLPPPPRYATGLKALKINVIIFSTRSFCVTYTETTVCDKNQAYLYPKAKQLVSSA